ncbi:vesicle transport through interaction with t-SNAREs -like protein [Labeo rohita]|uniref:Vesicle transport through interaction with t-SNAREs-like protein n=2 Tax=Labeo rohita TaxID=84645 RepID=A0A498LSL6_LABRO|nr:vesicle transport through interaction with t-SNAREs -like protein [Labeo rohita]
MSSDFEAYEQDFGTLTAEITNKIGRIPKLAGEEKTQLVLNVDKQLEEVRELLEQMDLEVREIPIQSRGMYNSRLKSYKQEMEKLEKDFKRSRIAYSDEVRNELLGDDGSSSESQRAHLLDNTERLERSSRRLEAGYQIAVETEQVGQEILANLHSDREKIQRSRDRLRETDANLGKSSRILTGMLRRPPAEVDGVRESKREASVGISAQRRAPAQPSRPSTETRGLIPHAGGRVSRQADQKVKPLGGPPFEMGMGQTYQTENITKPRTAEQLHIHGPA